MTNAKLIIRQGDNINEIPVTWTNDGIIEGEEIYFKIFQSEEYINWDDTEFPEFDVILSENDQIRSRVTHDDMASVLYPTRRLNKLLEKK